MTSGETDSELPPTDSQSITAGVEPVEADVNLATSGVEAEMTDTKTISVHPESCHALRETSSPHFNASTDEIAASTDCISRSPARVYSAQHRGSLRRVRSSLPPDRVSLASDRMSLAGIRRTLVSDRISLVEFYASLTQKLHGQRRPPVRWERPRLSGLYYIVATDRDLLPTVLSRRQTPAVPRWPSRKIRRLEPLLPSTCANRENGLVE
jgi:hypothetical protein